MPASSLTHERMHEIIESGESFLHDGQVVKYKEHIPTPESLAVTSDDKTAVKSALQAELDALQRRLAQINSEGTTAEAAASASQPTGEDAAKKAESDRLFEEKRKKAEADAEAAKSKPAAGK